MANDDPFFTSGRGDSMGAKKGFSKDVNATFKNLSLKGDILNSYMLEPGECSFRERIH